MKTISETDLMRIPLSLGVSSDGLFGGCIKPASATYFVLERDYIVNTLVPKYLDYLIGKGLTHYDANRWDCSKYADEFIAFCNRAFAASPPDFTGAVAPCAMAVAQISGPHPWPQGAPGDHVFAAFVVENETTGALELLCVETVYGDASGNPAAQRFYTDMTKYDWTQVELWRSP